jgi:hypothetical protein
MRRHFRVQTRRVLQTIVFCYTEICVRNIVKNCDSCLIDIMTGAFFNISYTIYTHDSSVTEHEGLRNTAYLYSKDVASGNGEQKFISE